MCAILLGVPSYWGYHPTGGTILLGVPSYRGYHPTGGTILLGVPSNSISDCSSLAGKQLTSKAPLGRRYSFKFEAMNRARNRNARKVCLYDGKIEGKHMTRHYQRQHIDSEGHMLPIRVLPLIDLSEETKLAESLENGGKPVEPWCVNWREIALAIKRDTPKG
jgi:hypothetical protein